MALGGYSLALHSGIPPSKFEGQYEMLAIKPSRAAYKAQPLLVLSLPPIICHEMYENEFKMKLKINKC